jgi:uncharacterized protein Yka (UPF0111/DUF47 family)
MKSDILVSLIKEVVKNEVKTQVKEELIKLIKSGAVTLNTQKKATPSLAELTETNNSIRKQAIAPTQQRTQQPKREFTKDPMINEILNMTQPFTSEQRKEGAQAVGSVLDMIKPELRVDESEWETMDFREGIQIPQNVPNFESTGDGLQDATIKALTRNYSELVKRF